MKKIFRTALKVVSFPVKVVLFPIGAIGILIFNAVRKKGSGDSPI